MFAARKVSWPSLSRAFVHMAIQEVDGDIIYLAIDRGLARFIKGTNVGTVWCEFYDEKNEKWNKPRLLFSANSELGAEDIIIAYAKRWRIQSSYHELKNA